MLAAGSDAQVTHAFRLGAGGDPNAVAAWQQVDPPFRPASRRSPASPAAASPRCSSPRAPDGNLFVSARAAGWSPPVGITRAVNNNDFRLISNAKGRSDGAGWTYSGLPPRST